MSTTPKFRAAQSAIRELPPHGVVGLGSGSTVAEFIRILGEHTVREDLDFLAVPTSYQSYRLAIKHGIPLTDLSRNPSIDIAVDGADEVDQQLNLTKGGGGALLQEKIVASAAKRFIIIVDESKLVDRLATHFFVPVEVIPFACDIVMRKIADMGVVPHLRQAERKVGPVVTDNGNFILDLEFPEPIENPAEVEVALKMVPGVVETGLFVGMADEVHVGTASGVFVLRQ